MDERTKTIDSIVRNKAAGEQWVWDAVAAAYDAGMAVERERCAMLRADRDCEKRLRKDSDDLATDLRLALEAVMSRPSDTGLAWAVLERIHGVGSGCLGPNVAGNRLAAGKSG